MSLISAGSISPDSAFNFDTFFLMISSQENSYQYSHIVTKGKLLLIFFSITQKNIGIFKCIDMICTSCVY